MAECKHGLKQGCTYCHVAHVAGGRPASRAAKSAGGATRSGPRAGQAAPKPLRGAARLAEQMNERTAKLKQRLRELRGE